MFRRVQASLRMRHASLEGFLRCLSMDFSRNQGGRFLQVVSLIPEVLIRSQEKMVLTPWS